MSVWCRASRGWSREWPVLMAAGDEPSGGRVVRAGQRRPAGGGLGVGFPWVCRWGERCSRGVTVESVFRAVDGGVGMAGQDTKRRPKGGTMARLCVCVHAVGGNRARARARDTRPLSLARGLQVWRFRGYVERARHCVSVGVSAMERARGHRAPEEGGFCRMRRKRRLKSCSLECEVGFGGGFSVTHAGSTPPATGSKQTQCRGHG